MSIQDTADSVTDRLIEIIPFYQHGEETRNGPALASPRALEQTRQHCENRGGITFTCRWFADREPDLALRHCVTGDRVHHEHDIHTLVAKGFSNGHSDEGGLQADQRRLIGGRYHNDRARQSLWSQIPLQEFAHFASSFADQRDHGNIAFRISRNGTKQSAFPYTASSKDTHTLTSATRQHAVENTHTSDQRLLDRRAL